MLNSGSNCSGLARKSQNMTECVPVPTSEHVAEIVGRQGKKSQLHFFIVDLEDVYLLTAIVNYNT